MLHDKRIKTFGIHTEHMDIVLAIMILVLSFDMFQGLEQMFDGFLVRTDLEIISLFPSQDHPAEFLMHCDVPVI